MSLFNLIAIPIVFSGLFKLFKAPTPKAKVAILRQSSFNLSSSRTAAPHIHRLITDRLQTNVFVASKLIVRAQRAKAAVAKRKANEAKNKMNNWTDAVEKRLVYSVSDDEHLAFYFKYRWDMIYLHTII